MLVLGVMLLVMTIIALVASLRRSGEGERGPLGRSVLTAAAAGVLFLLPYALWAAGALPPYLLAGLFGALLAAGAILAGKKWIRPQPLAR
jgi:hypothetical protein